MMIKGPILRVMLFFFLTCFHIVTHADNAPVFVTIASGRVHGDYYAAARAVCERINQRRQEHGIRCSVAYSDGSVANVISLRAGEYEMGLVQSDIQFHAFHGTGVFRDRKPFLRLRSLMSLFPEAFTVLVHPGSGIETFRDLRGKRVELGKSGSGGREVAERVLRASGLKGSDLVRVVTMNPLEEVEAFCAGRLDAIVLMVGHPSQAVREIWRRCPATFIGPEEETIQRLLFEYPYYFRTTISKGFYPGLDHDVATFGVTATLVTTVDLPDWVAYEVVEAVFGNLPEFRKRNLLFSVLQRQEMTEQGLTAPLHEGAKRYFREHFISDTEISAGGSGAE